MENKFNIIYILMIAYLFSSKPDVAVIDFSYNGIAQSDAEALSDRLRAELVKLEKYNVLDRKSMEATLSEQYFQSSGCVSDKCMVEIGNMIGAKQIIGGSISKLDNYYSVFAKIVDVETGKIIKTATFDSDETISYLLLYGMKDIAHQLSSVTVPINTSKMQSQIKTPHYGEASNKKINWKKPFYPYSLGIESFGLPYKTNGKNMSYWVSYYSMKLKYSQGNIEIPEVYINDGFEKMRVNIKLLSIEIYGNDIEMDGAWAGLGIMSFDGSLGIINSEERGNFELIRLGGSCGYNKNTIANISFNTYIGIYMFILGDNEFMVGNRVAKSDIIVPFISVDIGWHI